MLTINVRQIHPSVIRWLVPFACLSGLLHGEPDADTYVLRPNDSIRLEVYEEADLSTKTRILRTGQASFPLIGSVNISGLSVSAAAEKIRELYAKDYLVDPKVMLTVDEYATDFVSVMGAVKTPGQIPIPVSGNFDLAAALSTAGGLTETADTNSIQLVRATGATTTFSMDSLKGKAGQTKLAAGDRVVVSQSAYVGKTVTVMGPVAKAGAVPFPVNGKLDLINAIAFAGGLTEMAKPRKITINRKGAITTVDYNELSQGGRQCPLQPDDIITVVERRF